MTSPESTLSLPDVGLASAAAKTVLVREEKLGELVVVKHFHPTMTSSPDPAHREARWLAQANHKGVVRLLRNDQKSLTTPHVGAPTLRLAKPPPRQAARMLQEIAGTLADLHDRGLVHGALTPDHLLVSADACWLCSPSDIDRPQLVDTADLGRCVQWMLAEWDRAGTKYHKDWTVTANRLVDAAEPLAMRRTVRLFDDLAVAEERRGLLARRGRSSSTSYRQPPSPPNTTKRQKPGKRERAQAQARRSLPGVRALAAFLVVMIGGLAFANRDLASAQQPTIESGQLLVVMNGTMTAGTTSDEFFPVPNPCPGNPVAYLLDRTTSVVWSFDQAVDGTVGEQRGTAPGAVEFDDTMATGQCSAVSLVGPAGRTAVLD